MKIMAGPGSSMLYSFLLFTVILSLQEMYRGKLASTELFTILGGFISSLLFLVLLTVSVKLLINSPFSCSCVLFSFPAYLLSVHMSMLVMYIVFLYYVCLNVTGGSSMCKHSLGLSKFHIFYQICFLLLKFL